MRENHVPRSLRYASEQTENDVRLPGPHVATHEEHKQGTVPVEEKFAAESADAAPTSRVQQGRLNNDNSCIRKIVRNDADTFLACDAQ